MPADPDASDWDDAAASFDDEPDHGLRDPDVRAAWAELLTRHLPPAPCRVLDLGCGTGTLSVLLASLGYVVVGADLSGGMLARARAKASSAGVEVPLVQGDAAAPPVSGPFDAPVCRHVLWALPDPGRCLARWAALLRPGGRLVLVEGRWSTGAGITAADLLPCVERTLGPARLERLTDLRLWGRPIDDERYLLSAAR